MSDNVERRFETDIHTYIHTYIQKCEKVVGYVTQKGGGVRDTNRNPLRVTRACLSFDLIYLRFLFIYSALI